MRFADVRTGRIERSFLVVLIVLPLSFSISCTARYSHSLSGPIPKKAGTPVATSATGLSVFAIAFKEPTPAHEQVMQLLGPCRSLNNVQVDYREKQFIIVGIPEISLKATCVK